MKFLYPISILLSFLVGHLDAFGIVEPWRPLIRQSSVTQLFAEGATMAALGTTITMPALSSTMKEGRVVSWLKSEGDAIEAGEAIMVVESDKADMDVEAFEDGFLAKIIVEEGGMAPVGEAVALIAENLDEIEAVIAAYNGVAAPAAPAQSAQKAPAAPASGRLDCFWGESFGIVCALWYCMC
jgi:hypothetical protein